MLLFRILKKRMGSQYTIGDIIRTLKGMSITKLTEDAYIPHYTQTDIPDKIYEVSDFGIDFQLLEKKY